MESVSLFGSGLVITVFVIPWIKKFSLKFGYLDRPEEDSLKVHKFAIPNSGGIIFFWIFGLFMFILLAFNKANGSDVFGLLLGGGIVFGLGIWDDLKTVTPYFRLIGQILAAVILILSGTRIEAVFLISFPLTIFYVLGAINALNMEDGLDGLAGGMGLISFVGFGLISLLKAQPFGLIISSLMAGVLLGFLFYNFNPSSIFMGDNGSYFLGFVLAYLTVKFTSVDHWSSFFGPILIIGTPVLDVAYAILRRLKRGVSPFVGDRSHFYDQLIQKGLTVRQTVLICWSIQVVLVGTGFWIYSL
jgi:UDP-GlcNAc:undecaprenyl-phosphate GlcNAc-1-phosphate transferase